ncbi:MAG: hypothetical protein FWE71_03695 [Nocardioidaceae bacterium]|nr:hypothetical protein [Nocardioidaceae bacterium]MCL2613508.1 hypothetical protein [Nocardioidaceae bacterium]
MAYRLTSHALAFLVDALLDGRLSRAAACRLVTPWVEGDALAEPLHEELAQTLHGLDVVRGDDGLERHQSHGATGDLVVDESTMTRALRTWLDRLDTPS